jgi:hypothetical protein
MEKINSTQRKSYVLNQRQPLRIKKTSLLKRRNHLVITKKTSMAMQLYRVLLRLKWMMTLFFYENE